MGFPWLSFPLFQTHYSFSCQPAPGACNTNIYKLNDGENMAHPGRQPVVKWMLFMRYNGELKQFYEIIWACTTEVVAQDALP